MKGKIGLIVGISVALSAGLIIGLTSYIINDRQKIYHLKIAAGSKGGDSYTFSQVIAQVVSKHNPKIQIEAIETEGSEANIKLLETNQVQLATAQADIPTLPASRMVSLLFPDTFQLVVTQKSGINNVGQLKGKRIGLPPLGGGQYKSFWVLAAHYRLASTDFAYRAMSETEADLAFRNNQIDAVFRVRATGNKSIQKLVQDYGGRLIPIDQAAAMKIRQSAFEPLFIPKGAYQGNPPIPPVDLPTVAVQRTLLANKNVDAEVIREITQILAENRQELATQIPLAAYIAPPNYTGGTGLPLHLGSQAYYDREKPSFFQENADYLALWLTVIILLFSWIWGLKTWWEKKQKNRADFYNQDLVELIAATYNSNEIQEIREIRQKLVHILTTVVSELDEDRISAESFESFTFTWESAIAAVRDREHILITEQKSRLN
ncbi:TAXI family TRAP transporter solute-binding subunit [Merismopedia glauca]|uniref:TRAP transporter substrate-binding protein n=1 Tax=Merismopedia glauca CCAP 1448/3 TaxID=1296344 RepID=A0A2T1BZ68_9CYAN|nr:TAXI family TRAP transporter solute-binding subunit [Merismopedia glauca]PSB01292.1 TRAP transporter substrate-binding protein [Merismopedia glauca CCAP 1448/3]